jgi:hypothetical protein
MLVPDSTVAAHARAWNHAVLCKILFKSILKIPNKNTF